MEEVTFYREQQNNLNLRWYEYFLTKEKDGKPNVTDLWYIYDQEEGMYGINSEYHQSYTYCSDWIKMSFNELEAKMIKHYERIYECKVLEVIEIIKLWK
jgi:hypothetical protein